MNPPRARTGQLIAHVGDRLEFRCLSRESKPQTQLDWIINDKINLTATTATGPDSSRLLETNGRRFIKMPKVAPAREITKSDESIHSAENQPAASATTHELIESSGRTLVRPLDGPNSSAPISVGALDQLPESSMSVLNFTVSADLIHYLQTTPTAASARVNLHHQKWSSQKTTAGGGVGNKTSPGFAIKTKKTNGDQRKAKPNRHFDDGHEWPLDIRCVARVMHLSMSDAIRLRVTNSSRNIHSSASTSVEAGKQERRTQSNSEGRCSAKHQGKIMTNIFKPANLFTQIFRPQSLRFAYV